MIPPTKLTKMAQAGYLPSSYVARLFHFSSSAPENWPSEFFAKTDSWIRWVNYAMAREHFAFESEALKLPKTASQALTSLRESGFCKQ